MIGVGSWVAGLMGLGVFAAGCGGKDDSNEPFPSFSAGTGSSATTSGTGGTGTAGSSSGSSTGGTIANGGKTSAEICAASCKTQAPCLAISEATCVSQCNAAGQILMGECVDLQLAEYECIGNLTCDELKQYANDKLIDAKCGATYAEFATTCLRDGTMPPQPCIDFCTKTKGCRPTARDVNGCAQTCNELLTGYKLAGGEGCAAAFENAYVCFGTLECSDIDVIFDQQLTPVPCAQHDQLVTNACR